jgi:AraC-like DNA-binding protein
MRAKTLKLEVWKELAKEAQFDAGRVALMLSISQRQLQRLMKRQFEETPSRWLHSLRCQLARNLVSKGYSTKAAAAEMGFSSESHMCHQFKRFFGCPPQSFAPIPEALLKCDGARSSSGSNG